MSSERALKDTTEFYNITGIKEVTYDEDEKIFNLMGKYTKEFLNSQYYNYRAVHNHVTDFKISQLICTNFFYPAIKEEKLNILLDTINANFKNMHVNYSSSGLVFNKRSEAEKMFSGRKTCFSFYIKTKEDKEIYFDVKYNESSYYKASEDQVHKNKYRYVYEDAFLNSRYIKNEFKNMEFFLENYEIMKSLMHMCKYRYVVFVYTEKNLAIKEQLDYIKNTVLKDTSRVSFVSFEEILRNSLNLLDGNLKNYYEDVFIKNYLDNN